MGRNESRVGKLEAQTITRSGEPYVRVIAKQGEAPGDCVRRHGLDPDRTGANYIMRCIVEPIACNGQGGGSGQD